MKGPNHNDSGINQQEILYAKYIDAKKDIEQLSQCLKSIYVNQILRQIPKVKSRCQQLRCCFYKLERGYFKAEFKQSFAENTL